MQRFALAASAITLLAAQPTSAQTPLPQLQDSYFVSAQQDFQAILARQPNTNRAKNVVLFVVDGLSIPTITAARILEGQKRGEDGESNILAFERLLPWVGLSKTYTHDSQVADSAPTSTALVSGVKSVNGTIGVTQGIRPDVCVSQEGNEVVTIFEQAEERGLATGIVSTARITHATPAATFAKVAGRDWGNDANLTDEARQNGCTDIAAQLIDWPAGDGFEVVMGGGRANFMLTDQPDPENAERSGSREDGRDLVAEWQEKNPTGTYVWNREGFDAMDPAETDRIFALFNASHMQYEADREGDTGGEPSLAEMTTKAIETLSRNDEGFVLMIEAGRVDHAHHAGNAYRALTDTIAASEAVDAVMAAVDPEETLVVFTADHSHVFTIGGYPERNHDILGIAGDADDGKPFTTLGYHNGPGALADKVRADLTEIDTTEPGYKQQALVPLESETHAGDDVAIYAQGPFAHLFQGVIEQNVVYHVMAHALGFDAENVRSRQQQ